jgi:hypothetical protein
MWHSYNLETMKQERIRERHRVTRSTGKFFPNLKCTWYKWLKAICTMLSVICRIYPQFCSIGSFPSFLCLLLKTKETILTLRVDLNHDTSAQTVRTHLLFSEGHLLNCRRIHKQILHVFKDLWEIDCPCDWNRFVTWPWIFWIPPVMLCQTAINNICR